MLFLLTIAVEELEKRVAERGRASNREREWLWSRNGLRIKVGNRRSQNTNTKRVAFQRRLRSQRARAANHCGCADTLAAEVSARRDLKRASRQVAERMTEWVEQSKKQNKGNLKYACVSSSPTHVHSRNIFLVISSLAAAVAACERVCVCFELSSRLLGACAWYLWTVRSNNNNNKANNTNKWHSAKSSFLADVATKKQTK